MIRSTDIFFSRLKKSDFVARFALNGIILSSVIFLIGLPIYANFLTIDDPVVLLSSRIEALYFYYGISGILGIGAILNYGPKKLIFDNYSIFLLISIISLWVSLLLSGSDIKPMIIISPFFMLLTFHVFPKFDFKVRDISNIIVLVLVAFLLLPILLYFFPDIYLLPFDLEAFDSFRGFAFSRTDYGFLAGLAVLLLLVKPSIFRLFLVPPLFLGLVLSENRAGFIALILSLGVLFSPVLKKVSLLRMLKFLLLTFLALLLGFLFSRLQNRGITIFQDPGSRIQILQSTLEGIYPNFFWGTGKFYQAVYVHHLNTSIEPHNLVLQSLLNFGFIPSLLWFLLLARVFFSLKMSGRAILVYMMIFGFFHPSFDAYLFVPESILPLLLAAQLGASDLPPKSIDNNSQERLMRNP